MAVSGGSGGRGADVFHSNILSTTFAVCFKYLVFCCSETQVKKRLSIDPEKKKKKQHKKMLLKTFYSTLNNNARKPYNLGG